MLEYISCKIGESLIELRGLTKIFSSGNVKAVNNVSFKLNQGEIGCIIGTSGCGKTTTLKMINRLIEPSEGEIIVGDKFFNEVNAVKWRREIGYVIQKAGLLPHLTIKENISILSKILKKPNSFIDNRVRELMEIINLPFDKYKNFYPKELSGGQQQRVGIARALMEDPPVMLMDEPFGALDPITRESLHDEFIDLNKKLKKTILIVTHDMSEAFKLADKIILMNKGEIIQMGNKESLINQPANEFVEEFVKGHGYD